jgi:hypothetical protein
VLDDISFDNGISKTRFNGYDLDKDCRVALGYLIEQRTLASKATFWDPCSCHYFRVKIYAYAIEKRSDRNLPLEGNTTFKIGLNFSTPESRKPKHNLQNLRTAMVVLTFMLLVTGIKKSGQYRRFCICLVILVRALKVALISWSRFTALLDDVAWAGALSHWEN